MNYKEGSVVTNEAGIQVKVKKDCLKCHTLTKNEAHGSYKCCMKRSCPGWTYTEPRMAKTYLVFEDMSHMDEYVGVACKRMTGDEIRKKYKNSQWSISIAEGKLIKKSDQIINLDKL